MLKHSAFSATSVFQDARLSQQVTEADLFIKMKCSGSLYMCRALQCQINSRQPKKRTRQAVSSEGGDGYIFILLLFPLGTTYLS